MRTLIKRVEHLEAKRNTKPTITKVVIVSHSELEQVTANMIDAGYELIKNENGFRWWNEPGALPMRSMEEIEADIRAAGFDPAKVALEE